MLAGLAQQSELTQLLRGQACSQCDGVRPPGSGSAIAGAAACPTISRMAGRQLPVCMSGWMAALRSPRSQQIAFSLQALSRMAMSAAPPSQPP